MSFASGRRQLSSSAAAGLIVAAAATLAACGAIPPSVPAVSPAATAARGRVLVDDRFEATTLDSRIWSTCYWWNDSGCTITTNHELEWYQPEGVGLSDGTAHLTAEPMEQRGADGSTYPFRSGMISTGPPSEHQQAKVAFTYGTVQARLKVPAGKGLWSAMWLLPADTSSRPEIDVLEILGNDPTESIMHLHPADRQAESPGKTVRIPGTDFSTGFHDFELDWRPSSLTWLIDGRQVWRVTGQQVPRTPMYVIFNLAVGGAYPGDPDGRTRFPAQLAIDHVKITSATP